MQTHKMNSIKNKTITLLWTLEYLKSKLIPLFRGPLLVAPGVIARTAKTEKNNTFVISGYNSMPRCIWIGLAKMFNLGVLGLLFFLG